MPQSQSEAQIAATIAATQQASQQLRSKLLAYIEALWASLGSWRDTDVPKFVNQVLPVVAGAQQQMAALTSASLAAQRQSALAGRFAPPAIDVTKLTGAAVRGVDPVEEYTRPFRDVWGKLDTLPHQPGAIEQAVSDGLKRAQNLAATDLQLAKRATASADSQRDDKILGYRRVLEGTYSCALCVVAATLRYRVDTVRSRGGSLFPIHPGCDCGIAPIYDKSEILRRPTSFSVDSQVRLGDGRLVSLSDIDAFHGRIQETFGRADSGARTFGVTGSKGREIAYRDVIVAHDHGELGRVLAVRGQHFEGPDGRVVRSYALT